MKAMRTAVMAMIMMGLTTGLASADVLVMQEGADIKGEIVQETDEHVVINTDGITLAIEKTQIRDVKRGAIMSKPAAEAPNDILPMEAKKKMNQMQHKGRSWLAERKKDLRSLWAKTKYQWKKLKRSAKEKGWFKPAGKDSLDKTKIRKEAEKSKPMTGQKSEKFKTLGDVRESNAKRNEQYDQVTE